MFWAEVPEKHYMIRKSINFPKTSYSKISFCAINGSQNEPIPILKFNFNSQRLGVGYDIEMLILSFLVCNDAFLN